ncbi:uncharacterized protein LOC144905537 [Branchiostoma floridae x Branchiostoma belcheri]
MDHRARKWWNRLLGRKSRGDSKDRKDSRGGAGPGQQPPYKEDSDAENRKPDEVPNGNARKSSTQTSKSAQVRSKCNPKLAESSNSELSRSQQSSPWRNHLSVSHSGRFKEKRKQRGTVSDRPELYHGPPKPLETDL